METFDIAFLIISVVSAVILFMLVFLLIGKKRHLFIESPFQNGKQKDTYGYFDETKISGGISVKGGREFLDFSGGRLGI